MKELIKIRNGTIHLPKKLQKSWKRAEVLVFPSEDTLIVKKVEKPAVKLSQIADRITLPRLNSRQIQKEIEAYRRGK